MKIHVGHEERGGKPEEWGTIELNKQGEIEITHATSQQHRERLAHLLTSMFHDRYPDETALFQSLPARLNNGYMWARTENTTQHDAGGGADTPTEDDETD